MENYLHDIEWIERYLDRSLNPEERREMEQKMMEDPALKNKFLEYKEVIEGIRYSHLREKLDQLRALEGALPGIEVKPEGKQVWLGVPLRTLAVAASIALVVVSYFLLNRPEDPAALYAKYFEPYPNVFEPTVRGAESQGDKRAAAFYAYDQGDYQQAARLFEELLKEKQEAGVLLLLGNANLVLDRTEEAQNNFLTVIKDFDELDAQAKWFLALSYLKEGKQEKAQLILQELESPKDTYSKKAIELLKEVR